MLIRFAFIIIDRRLIMDILTLRWRGPDARVLIIVGTRLYLIAEFFFCVYIDKTWLWVA